MGGIGRRRGKDFSNWYMTCGWEMSIGNGVSGEDWEMLGEMGVCQDAHVGYGKERKGSEGGVTGSWRIQCSTYWVVCCPRGYDVLLYWSIKCTYIHSLSK